MSDALEMVAMVYSVWDQISADRCCLKRWASCHYLPAHELRTACKCFSAAVRRVAESEKATAAEER